MIAARAEDDVEAAPKMCETMDEPPPEHPAVQSGVASLEGIAGAIVRQIATNEARDRLAEGASASRVGTFDDSVGRANDVQDPEQTLKSN